MVVVVVVVVMGRWGAALDYRGVFYDFDVLRWWWGVVEVLGWWWRGRGCAEDFVRVCFFDYGAARCGGRGVAVFWLDDVGC